MLSLPAAQDKDGLGNWMRRLGRLGVDAERQRYVIEPKVDGLAVRLVYRCARMRWCGCSWFGVLWVVFGLPIRLYQTGRMLQPIKLVWQHIQLPSSATTPINVWDAPATKGMAASRSQPPGVTARRARR